MVWFETLKCITKSSLTLQWTGEVYREGMTLGKVECRRGLPVRYSMSSFALVHYVPRARMTVHFVKAFAAGKKKKKKDLPGALEVLWKYEDNVS